MGAGVFASIPNIHGGCRALLFDFDMDYEKAYKAVLKTATQWIKDGCTDKEKICLECVFPELRESEDERIRKWLVDYFSSIKATVWIHRDITCEQILDWLEKQKEQKPNIELIQRSWYMEGYHDREFGKEPMWIIKTGEGGPKHELNPKYGQPLTSEQKPELVQHPPITYTYPSDASRDEQLKLALIALLNNDLIQVRGSKFTKQDLIDWVEQKPAWSEEDEKIMQTMIKEGDLKPSEIAWLKSLRPSWKPSEEQMNALNFAITYMFSTKANPTVLRDLYNDLLKLK